MTFALLLVLGSTYPISDVSCYDGDTCTAVVHLGFDIMTTKRIRLCGIDAPEVKGMSKPRGILVRDVLQEWVDKAGAVRLEVPANSRDKYGRTLGWILADGENLNAKLVHSRLAAPYRMRCR